MTWKKTASDDLKDKPIYMGPCSDCKQQKWRLYNDPFSVKIKTSGEPPFELTSDPIDYESVFPVDSIICDGNRWTRTLEDFIKCKNRKLVAFDSQADQWIELQSMVDQVKFRKSTEIQDFIQQYTKGYTK